MILAEVAHLCNYCMQYLLNIIKRIWDHVKKIVNKQEKIKFI